jgi:hypothetical protein
MKMKYPSYTIIRELLNEDPDMRGRLLLSPGQHLALDALGALNVVPGFSITWGAMTPKQQNVAFKKLARTLCDHGL